MNVVLLSHIPLPTRNIGSWTVLYDAYLKGEHNISYIICPQINNGYLNIKYFFAKEPTFMVHKLSYLVKYYKYKDYWKQLEIIVTNESQPVIVKVIDNVNLLLAIDYYAKKKGIRDKIKILFFMHGFSYFLDRKENHKFYDAIDELIVLTHSSYKYLVETSKEIPCEISVLYNGIASDKFHMVNQVDKQKIKNKLKFDNNKIYFLWLSQDRPKKGLHIILRAWDQLVKKYGNLELLIIGTHNEIKGKQIKWLGRIPNEQLPQYYQAVDFYLFPTLWHEGFGLSLAEAMKCGAVCLASDIDPIPEVMGEGKYGRLVGFPHSVQSWVDAIEEEMEKYIANNKVNPYLKNIPEKLYDLDAWCENMNNLLLKWKRRCTQ